MSIFQRPRLLRKTESLRRLVREVKLSVDDFVVPIFVTSGNSLKESIDSMPGYYRLSLDRLEEELDILAQLGLHSVLVFAKIEEALKDNKGSEALNPNGLIPKAINLIKSKHPQMTIMADVALDPYSSYGHDGIVKEDHILNDETVEVLARMSVLYAKMGADVIAPSDMMDGRVREIRKALEIAGYKRTAIMSYTAKYASAFYGPFRDALDSAPGFGDKKTYQMDYSNRREALRELALDEGEGADIIMVKPAMAYLDIIRDISLQTTLPVAAYQVSGEYAMIRAAAERGWLDYKDTAMEQLTAIRRSGADIIVSYFSKEVARWLTEETRYPFK